MNEIASMAAHIERSTAFDAPSAFPYLQDRVYLNTAATGLAWPGAGIAVNQFYNDALTRGFDGRDDWQRCAQETTTALIGLLGHADKQIDYFSNTTHALNLVAHSIAWREGDSVLVAADEHPSVIEPWSLSTRTAPWVELVHVSDESERSQVLASAMTPNTRVLAVSHVNSLTGTRVDLDFLSSACKNNGTILAVDGIQAVGAIPVNIGNIDVYCAATFKWLLSGFGLAFMATSAFARENMRPAFRGYKNIVPSNELQYSHLNYPALYVLKDSLLRFEKDRDAIFRKVQRLSTTLKEQLVAMGCEVVTPIPANQSAGIVTITQRGPNEASRLVHSLAQRHISVAAKGSTLRISPHFYNTDNDIAHLIRALKKDY